ncbi:MAG: PAS domain-containing protein [Chloroflexi bacterium]|nr:PAS domain-containing protein [Chloroflexota bacterium]
MVASNTPVISAERRIAVSSMDRRWVLVTKVPLRNEDEEVVGLVGIARDITLRKQAEEALRKSEEYLQAVIASTPVILFVLDMDGRLTLLDGQGVSIFGDRPDDLIGMPFLTVLRDYIPDIDAHFQLVLVGEETWTIQAVGDRIFDLHHSPLRNKQGELAGMIGVATDITEQLRTERLRIELEKEQEMIAMKERFIATASHDFRSPLAVMRMSVNMLEMYYDRLSLEKRRSTLQQINTQIDRMTRLLDDVLKLSKARASKVEFHPQPIALKLFCEQIWDSYQHSPGNTRIIELVYDCQDDRFFIDPELIHYILANLISNAIKYSSDDGMVRFEVKQVDGELVFRISDNGIGIPLQDQANLFEPYHRATNTGGIEGTGLGLSIVKSYVEVHHGRIEFESEQGKGTMFAVYIPIRREPA